MTTSTSVARDRGTSGFERRPGGRRFSIAHVLIVVVAILAFVLNLLVLRSREATVMVATAGQDAPLGARLSEELIHFVPVAAAFDAVDSLLVEDSLARFEGWVLTRSVDEGDLITIDHLVKPGSPGGLRAMSLPVDPAHAAGGRLVVGDRVDIITVSDAGAIFVATDLEVTAIANADSGSFSSSAHHVVVGVTADEALQLAEAMDHGSIEVIRATGATPIADGMTNDDP